MINPDTLLEGNYPKVFAEVTTHDIYKLWSVKFQPDVIFDIGANVGIFTRHARMLFPKALIVALEPHPENCKWFRELNQDLSNIVFVEAALGDGDVYHVQGAKNGAMEVYLTAGLGYKLPTIKSRPERWYSTVVQSYNLVDLLGPYVSPGYPGHKFLLKCDCEGGENSIWDNPTCMDYLRKMDYIAMEIHNYAELAADLPEVRSKSAAALKSLEATHDCVQDGVYFWSTKRTQ